MSLKSTLFLKLASSLVALYFAAAISALAADTVVEAAPELVVPKESMFQAGKSYISRVSDRLVDTVTGKSDELINRAMEVIGVRYRWDVELPQSGLDGSSFVGYVFKDKLGFLLPRKSTQMSRVGKPVNREELQPGDLVFFNTMRLTFSHVGIYVGDNKFIHSPSKGTSVRVDDLSSLYWDKRFDGARRLDGSDNLNDAERQ
jgi:cell wall-associated NlpC family hydrolase